MNEQKVLMIDIESKSRHSTERKSDQPLWTRSDNSFKFDFLQEQDECADLQSQASSSSHKTEHTTSQITFTGQGPSFAFNFQIYPEEDMDTEVSDATTANREQSSEQGHPPSQEHSCSPSNTPASCHISSKKKKKKPGKNKAKSNMQKEPNESTVDGEESDRAELSTEEQLQRQLDWCIEQLEQGMRSHKATPKQKEEASQALKTLRSSKAPLVKKRMVMRTMAGDYRKKMEEEKAKQFKLIQNETASAQLRTVSEFPKKSVFHRKAGIKAPSENDTHSNNHDATAAPENDFVFAPSKEEFRFNFL